MFDLFLIWAMWIGTIMVLSIIEATTLLTIVLWAPFILVLLALIAVSAIMLVGLKEGDQMVFFVKVFVIILLVLLLSPVIHKIEEREFKKQLDKSYINLI